jgi:hypothetical protein
MAKNWMRIDANYAISKNKNYIFGISIRSSFLQPGNKGSVV